MALGKANSHFLLLQAPPFSETDCQTMGYNQPNTSPAANTVCASPPLPAMVRQGLFERVDQNRDGVITREELRNAFEFLHTIQDVRSLSVDRSLSLSYGKCLSTLEDERASHGQNEAALSSETRINSQQTTINQPFSSVGGDSNGGVSIASNGVSNSASLSIDDDTQTAPEARGTVETQEDVTPPSRRSALVMDSHPCPPPAAISTSPPPTSISRSPGRGRKREAYPETGTGVQQSRPRSPYRKEDGLSEEKAVWRNQGLAEERKAVSFAMESRRNDEKRDEEELKKKEAENIQIRKEERRSASVERERSTKTREKEEEMEMKLLKEQREMERRGERKMKEETNQ